jgi:hypothetical protein
MKLIDYLPYYIGCDYWTNNSQGNLNAKTLPDVIDMCKRDKGVQLHLRRLEGMTDEQAIELVRLVVHEDEFTNVSTYRHNHTNDLMVQWGNLTAAQRADDVEYYFNATGERSWSAAQFHYLLRQHFDLFNLIDNNLGIDIKTIQ